MHKRKVRKVLIWSIILCTLALFVFIMQSGGILKQPFGEEDNVIGYLSTVEERMLQEEWALCLRAYESLEKAWRIVESRVQYSVERDDLESMNHSLADLKGSIRGESLENALIGYEEVLKCWTQLEK